MKTVLVVEDDIALLGALAETLDKAGFHAVTAKDGEEGLAAVAREKPDLILLDIVMPKMDGLSMMHKLAERPETKAIPIIFLTNLSDMTTIGEIAARGTYDYLVKSDWDVHDIVLRVKKKLGVA